MQINLELPDNIALKLNQIDNPSAFISQLIANAFESQKAEEAILVDKDGILVIRGARPQTDLTNLVAQMRIERIHDLERQIHL